MQGLWYIKQDESSEGKNFKVYGKSMVDMTEIQREKQTFLDKLVRRIKQIDFPNFSFIPVRKKILDRMTEWEKQDESRRCGHAGDEGKVQTKKMQRVTPKVG